MHEAIFDLVELIKTYGSKNRLSKVLMSTLFKRRQAELEAAIDRAAARMQVSDARYIVVFVFAVVVRRGWASFESMGVYMPTRRRRQSPELVCACRLPTGEALTAFVCYTSTLHARKQNVGFWLRKSDGAIQANARSGSENSQTW